MSKSELNNYSSFYKLETLRHNPIKIADPYLKRSTIIKLYSIAVFAEGIFLIVNANSF